MPGSGGAASSSNASPAASKAASSGKKRRQLSRRDAEEQTSRDLAERFLGWSYCDTHVRRVDGQTLFERIMKAKREVKHSGGRLSSSWWRQARKDYEVQAPEMLEALTVNEQNLEIRSSLIDAIKKPSTDNCNRRTVTNFKQWLEHEAPPNQKEWVGILRFALTFRVSVGLQAATVVTNVATYAVKHGLKNQYPTEFEALRQQLSDALIFLWASFRKENICLERFWEKCSAEVSLLLPRTACEALMKANDWFAVDSHVADVVSADPLGQKLFSFAVSELAAAKWAKDITTAEASLDTAKSLTSALIVEVRSSLAEKSVEGKIDSALPERREIVCKFLGLDLKLKALYRPRDWLLSCRPFRF